PMCRLVAQVMACIGLNSIQKVPLRSSDGYSSIKRGNPKRPLNHGFSRTEPQEPGRWSTGMSQRPNEAAFESVIETYLPANGYVTVKRDSFDRERAIFPEAVLAFIRATQPKEWTRLEALHGGKTGEQILGDLCKWMDTNGVLATLRHGFKCYGRTLHAAYFKAAHELNPELEARYAANRLGLTRQLHFSLRSD